MLHATSNFDISSHLAPKLLLKPTLTTPKNSWIASYSNGDNRTTDDWKQLKICSLNLCPVEASISSIDSVSLMLTFQLPHLSFFHLLTLCLSLPCVCSLISVLLTLPAFHTCLSPSQVIPPVPFALLHALVWLCISQFIQFYRPSQANLTKDHTRATQPSHIQWNFNS